MILHAEQLFDKMLLDRCHDDDFIDYISYNVERELATKMMDKLKDHKLLVVKLHEPRFIDDLPPRVWGDQCAYRQDLECMELVQCKNCGRVYPWCQKFRDELGGEGFCPYGKEWEDND